MDHGKHGRVYLEDEGDGIDGPDDHYTYPRDVPAPLTQAGRKGGIRNEFNLQGRRWYYHHCSGGGLVVTTHSDSLRRNMYCTIFFHAPPLGGPRLDRPCRIQRSKFHTRPPTLPTFPTLPTWPSSRPAHLSHITLPRVAVPAALPLAALFEWEPLILPMPMQCLVRLDHLVKPARVPWQSFVHSNRNKG